MQFSFTHKMHLLLDHLPLQIEELSSGGDLDESFIKRWHQVRAGDDKKLKGLTATSVKNFYWHMKK